MRSFAFVYVCPSDFNLERFLRHHLLLHVVFHRLPHFSFSFLASFLPSLFSALAFFISNLEILTQKWVGARSPPFPTTVEAAGGRISHVDGAIAPKLTRRVPLS